MNFALRSRRVITPEGMSDATVVIQDGLISCVSSYDLVTDCPVEDLGDMVLMPGIVDSHVHINEPGRTDWEGFNTATQAAAVGGITTLVDMPLNCIPVTTSKSALEQKLSAVQNKLWVDCGFWGGVIPQSITDLDELLAAGVLGVKSFLIDSGIDEFPQVTENDIRRAMPIIAKHDVPYLIHAELDLNNDGATSADAPDSYPAFLATRPPSWETDAIDLMISLCRESKAQDLHCKVHIVHLSSAEALAAISAARLEGLKFTAETCPHYLTLHAEKIPNGNTLFKCCPPIRDENNRQRLWQGLQDGILDFIVSDHSPCTPELKLMQHGDVANAWGGISALQFGLPLIWQEARSRDFSLTDISKLMSTAPADFIGLGDIKGRIAAGYHADLMVFDDTAEYAITSEMIRHRHKITPYIDKWVCGETLRTYLRGQLVYAEKQLLGNPVGQPLLKGQL